MASEPPWGYDPKNYNVPEGDYATDPYQGEVRIVPSDDAVGVRIYVNDRLVR